MDNDELRDALKENGIGRPSTRAAIIETLFKRNYIRKEKKNLIATPTGVELIQTIHEELLKSAELTGIWEKKLREIERRTYNAAQFLEELKQMVAEIVASVLADRSNRRITVQTPSVEKRDARRSLLLLMLPRRSRKGNRKASSSQEEGRCCGCRFSCSSYYDCGYTCRYCYRRVGGYSLSALWQRNRYKRKDCLWLFGMA